MLSGKSAWRVLALDRSRGHAMATACATDAVAPDGWDVIRRIPSPRLTSNWTFRCVGSMWPGYQISLTVFHAGLYCLISPKARRGGGFQARSVNETATRPV